MDCKLTLDTWNANGLLNFLFTVLTQLLDQFLTDYDIDIFIINETKLTDNKTFKFANYNVHRRDRP